jgi:hypothetical protein
VADTARLDVHPAADDLKRRRCNLQHLEHALARSTDDFDHLLERILRVEVVAGLPAIRVVGIIGLQLTELSEEMFIQWVGNVGLEDLRPDGNREKRQHL